MDSYIIRGKEKFLIFCNVPLYRVSPKTFQLFGPLSWRKQPLYQLWSNLCATLANVAHSLILNSCIPFSLSSKFWIKYFRNIYSWNGHFVRPYIFNQRKQKWQKREKKTNKKLKQSRAMHHTLLHCKPNCIFTWSPEQPPPSSSSCLLTSTYTIVNYTIGTLITYGQKAAHNKEKTFMEQATNPKK